MKNKVAEPKFNDEVVKAQTKEVFISSHKSAYPGLDLSAVYDKIKGKTEKNAPGVANPDK